MNTINVTVQLCEEDRKRIDELIGFAGWIASELKDRKPPVIEPPKLFSKVPAEHPADAATTHFEPPAPAPDPVAVAPAAKPVSLGEFQKALVTRCAESATVKQKVQALVQQYADSVSNIPEDKRPEVLAALAKI